jgi:hypothetical protein
MDARLLALAAGVALAALLFVSVQRDLTAAGAGMQARALAGLAYAAMALSWGAVFLALTPLWVAWLATAGAFAVSIAPRALLRVPPLHVRRLVLPRARRDQHGLGAEIGAIRMGLSTLTTSAHERAVLRARLQRLERWRHANDPLARELVSLVEQSVNERLDLGPLGFDRARERRIRELLSRLEG